MNRPTALWLTLVLLLPACAPRIPPLPYPSAPSAPLVRKLEDHRQQFRSLKALARVEIERKGKRRVYESVAIAQLGFDRLRIEGYGPLGSSVFVLLWNGADVVFIPSDGSGVRTIGPSGFDRVLGVRMGPEDLCSVLVGSVPRPALAAVAAACSSDGRCALEGGERNAPWRVYVQQRPGEPVVVDAIEKYRRGDLAFLARYEGPAAGNDEYRLPRRLTVQDPDQQATVLIEYLDAEVNGPVSEELFRVSEPARSVP